MNENEINQEEAHFEIVTLRLNNFRKFEKLGLNLNEFYILLFHKRLTVLVANNGGGKTTILDAIAISLSPFVKDLCGYGDLGIQEKDVRRIQNVATSVPLFPVKVWSLFNTSSGKSISSLILKETLRGKTKRKEAKEIIYYAKKLKKENQLSAQGKGPTPIFPLVVYYGTARLWGTSKVTEAKSWLSQNMAMREAAYLDCLSSSSTFSFFKIWFEKISREAQSETASGTPSKHRPNETLKIFQKTFEILMRTTGWINLKFDFMENRILAMNSEGLELSVDSLSDGVRGALALVADLTSRAIRLNPQLGEQACELVPGIVLIDEVDLHLHPSWQQTILDSLQEAFPKVQFIVTTHSPQVLSTVKSECIRIIHDDGTVTRPQYQTRGVESATVLAEVMGVDPIPQVPEAKDLSEYRMLIEDGQSDFEEANELLDKLNNHFGENHPLMIECQNLKRFVEFKKARFSKQGENQ
jgi:predicted ATP-binding protein involved in virulence